MNENGELIMSTYDQLLLKLTKIVTVNHISNALGTINPVKYMIDKRMLLAQPFDRWCAGCLKPDMQALDCDFYVFSGHKLCGPTGTGILYGKKNG
jgi:cysteine desulfurase/selenocysteine lyase